MNVHDTHTHTLFSPDSKQSPEGLVRAAINQGLTYLAITDHFDNGSYLVKQEDVIDFDKYFATLTPLAETKSATTIAIGLELGFVAEKNAQNKEIIDKYPFDCIINSVHEVKGKDCYFEEYFGGKRRAEAYGDYLKAVRDSLDAPYHYDIVGHIGYVVRNSPYNPKEFLLSEFNDILDDILKTIIQKEKILEINTSVRGVRQNTIPDYDIIKRYYELGGRLISFGSDAHAVDRLASNYRQVNSMAFSIGFKHFTVVKDRKYNYINL